MSKIIFAESSWEDYLFWQFLFCSAEVIIPILKNISGV